MAAEIMSLLGDLYKYMVFITELIPCNLVERFLQNDGTYLPNYEGYLESNLW
jgi:hypothetical protein